MFRVTLREHFVVRTRPDMTKIIPVTYGYARVSKTEYATRNLETRLHILQEFGIREEHIFADEMTSSSMSRQAWTDLMTKVRFYGTVVAWLDRFSRNFDEGVKIQAELTKQNISIVAIRENINNTADDSAAAKLFRRMILAQGTYQVESTSERIKAGLYLARAEVRKPGRPPALTPEQVEECRRMYAEAPSIRRVARIMKVYQGTVKRALDLDPELVGRE